jgi:histidine triad (HIT) family protein
MDCIFCRIVSGEADSWRVYEDDECLAFLDAFPATRGHTLVVPKRHRADLLALDEHEAQAVMRGTWRVAHLLEERLVPLGLNVLQANRAAAWQSVFHMHVHVVPRYEDDGLRHTWNARPARREDLDEVHERLAGDGR